MTIRLTKPPARSKNRVGKLPRGADADPIDSTSVRKLEREALAEFVKARMLLRLDQFVAVGCTREEAVEYTQQDVNDMLRSLREQVRVELLLTIDDLEPSVAAVTWSVRTVDPDDDQVAEMGGAEAELDDNLLVSELIN